MKSGWPDDSVQTMATVNSWLIIQQVPFTAHTTNPVPFILIEQSGLRKMESCLADLALNTHRYDGAGETGRDDWSFTSWQKR